MFARFSAKYFTISMFPFLEAIINGVHWNKNSVRFMLCIFMRVLFIKLVLNEC